MFTTNNYLSGNTSVQGVEMTVGANSDLPGRLAFVAGRLNRRIRAAGGNLSHGLLSALATVQKMGPIRLADLAKQEFVSAPSTTRLVAELERRGLVTRTTDPDDGRAFLIEATAAGEAEVVRARAVRASMVATMLESLGPDEFSLLEKALPVLERAIEGDELPPRR
jgi:DNA-binding MarR family transcriptional regulator